MFAISEFRYIMQYNEHPFQVPRLITGRANTYILDLYSYFKKVVLDINLP